MSITIGQLIDVLGKLNRDAELRFVDRSGAIAVDALLDDPDVDAEAKLAVAVAAFSLPKHHGTRLDIISEPYTTKDAVLLYLGPIQR